MQNKYNVCLIVLLYICLVNLCQVFLSCTVDDYDTVVRDLLTTTNSVKETFIQDLITLS